MKATLNTDWEERANREMPNLKMDKNLDEILGYLPQEGGTSATNVFVTVLLHWAIFVFQILYHDTSE